MGTKYDYSGGGGQETSIRSLTGMYSTLQKNLGLTVTAISVHFWSAFLLSFCFSYITTHPSTSNAGIAKPHAATINSGLAAGALTLFLLYLLAIEDPLVACAARVVCFFFGCKILDLAVARAQNPPSRPDIRDSGMSSCSSQRHSTRRFDIDVQHRKRVEGLSSGWAFWPSVRRTTVRVPHPLTGDEEPNGIVGHPTTP